MEQACAENGNSFFAEIISIEKQNFDCTANSFLHDMISKRFVPPTTSLFDAKYVLN